MTLGTELSSYPSRFQVATLSAWAGLGARRVARHVARSKAELKVRGNAAIGRSEAIGTPDLGCERPERHDPPGQGESGQEDVENPPKRTASTVLGASGRLSAFRRRGRIVARSSNPR